jgi:hypothetical protein
MDTLYIIYVVSKGMACVFADALPAVPVNNTKTLSKLHAKTNIKFEIQVAAVAHMCACLCLVYKYIVSMLMKVSVCVYVRLCMSYIQVYRVRAHNDVHLCIQ